MCICALQRKMFRNLVYGIESSAAAIWVSNPFIGVEIELRGGSVFPRSKQVESLVLAMTNMYG